MAGGGGACLAQAVSANTAKGRHCFVQTENLIKTKTSDLEIKVVTKRRGG
jgi:hypothetical protein